MSDNELDEKLDEYYKSIPYSISVSSIRLDQIIKSRFKEGKHWKSYKITINK